VSYPGVTGKVRSRLVSLFWKAALILAALTAIAWGMYHWYFVATSGKAAEITATVKRANLPITVTERGDLESSKTVDVKCEVEGQQIKIVTILPEGTPVKKDQVVVTFDAKELKRTHDDQEVKWKQAEGKAKMNLEELEVQKNKTEGEIAKAKLDLTLAEIERDKYLEGEYKVEFTKRQGSVKLAEKDYQEATEKLETMRKLVKKGFQSPESLRLQELLIANKEFLLESSKADLMVLKDFIRKGKEVELKAKADDARRNLERSQASGRAAVHKAQSDLDYAEVTARLEETALQRAKKQLDRTVVKAPQDGILVYGRDRWWDDQSRIQAGAMVWFQQTIFSLPDLTKMQVKVKIHEAMVKKIKPGQKVEIRVESYANTVLHGTVEKVGTLANQEGFWDRGVKQYETIVKIEDFPSEAGLKPGMTAEVKILAGELANVLLVPVQSVSQKGSQHYSYVVTPAGIERREVTVGENNEKFAEIKNGLEEGEKVALDARARLAAETKGSDEKEEEKTSPEKMKPAPPPARATPTPK
jgi:HlyD family secretion protein